MILVTGATGHLGNAAIQFLLEKGVKANQIKALVRTEASAEDFNKRGLVGVVGDYDNYASLVSAFSGVDKLLFVSGSDIVRRLTQHQHVVRAAKEAGVKHVIYTSFQRKTETEASPLWVVAQSHLQTEKWIKESGLAYTILKNNLYLDFVPAFIGDKVADTGVVYLPAGQGKVSAALRVELAEAAANVITGTQHENKEYALTNAEAFSYQDVAEIISGLVGKTIRYVSPTVQEYTQTLTQAGVPHEVVGLFSSFAVAQAQGELEVVSRDLETILGRKPTSAKAFLATVFK